MTDIQRIRFNMTSLTGGPHVTTLYGISASALAGPFLTMMSAIKGLMPTGGNFAAEASGDTIDPVTGYLVGNWNATPPAGFATTGVGTYSAGVGMSVTWLTDTVVDRHRVRGRTYIVPLLGTQYANDGTLATSIKTALNTALATFQVATAGNFVVWHRPRPARVADGSRPAVTYRAGSYADVTASNYANRVAFLSSRRT